MPLNWLAFIAGVTILIFLIPSYVYSQRYKGSIILSDSDKPLKCRAFKVPLDSLLRQHFFAQCITQNHAKGYILAQIDSIDYSSNPPVAYGTNGSLYKWALLESDSISLRILEKFGLSANNFSGKPVKIYALYRLISKALSHYQNNGYPFARVSMSNTIFTDNQVITQLNFTQGPQIVFDTLYIKGNAKVSRFAIQSIIGFRSGDRFSQSAFNQFDSKLNRLPFITVLQDSEVEFTPGKARIYTYINQRPASRFSGIVGISSRADSKPGVLLTGSINLNIVNSLKNAESFIVRWVALGEGTQNLNLNAAWPYIFGSNLAIDGSFSLYKRDSSYLNVNPLISLNLLGRHGDKIGVGIDYRSSRTLSQSNTQTLNDYTTSLIRVNYGISNLPKHIFSPQGYDLNFGFSAGARKLKETSKPQLMRVNSIFQGDIDNRIHIPILNENLTGVLAFKGQVLSLLKNDEVQTGFSENELFRLGGLDDLRGFNQESILSDGYCILKSEIHLRASKLFGVFAFFDKSYVSAYNAEGKEMFWPASIGFGLLLDSNGGAFNVTYAMGKGFGQGYRLKDAKLHISYTANF